MTLKSITPDWFKLDDYSICKDFNIVAWYFNLHLRAQLLLPLYSLELYKEEEQEKVKHHAICDINDNWGVFINRRKILLTNTGIEVSLLENRDKMQIRTEQSIRPLTINEIHSLHHQQKDNYDPSIILNDVLWININLSETQLITEFSKYIRKIKQKMLPEHIKKDKKKYLGIIERPFTTQYFHRWISNAILPYMDLMLWQIHTGTKKIKDALICEVINIELDKLRGDTKPLLKRILTLDYMNILYTQASNSI